MYMIDEGWWFVPNPLNKFTVSVRNNPEFNEDGSLTLYFQANWLPAPKGDFMAMLPMYWLDPERLVEGPRNAKSELNLCRAGGTRQCGILPTAHPTADILTPEL